MVRYYTCAIKSCEDKQSPRHIFPDPSKYPALFKQWIAACRDNNLAEMNPNEVYTKKRICHIHFTPNDISSNVYLKKGVAIPSLYLPSRLEQGNISDIDKQSSDAESILNIEEIIPETEQDIPVQTPKRKNTQPLGAIIPSTSEENSSAIEQELVELHTPKRKRTGTALEDVGITKALDLTPKARKLYQSTVKLARSNRKLKRRNLEFKHKIKSYTQYELLEQITAPLNRHVAEFIKSQVRLQRTKPHGKRYSINDKCLGLVLYKQSPHAYRTFSKLFSVPSKKTLTTLLQRVHLETGINEHIFEFLKTNVQKMDEIDKLCLLLFDEMTIQPHITFNRKEGYFEGFEDFGDISSCRIADHAIVFMLRGINKNWKQPVAFAFSHNTIKSTDLVRMIKAIIKKCQDISLRVVGTVSDQGTSNVSAINYLMGNIVMTEEYPNRKCYMINNEIIYHIFDPPHLLKGIRNNLLTKNLIWKDGSDVYVSKWGDIYNAYLIDNASGQLRCMPKLTEEHCNPTKIRKMKVSFAAQTFSHTVAATINLLVRSGSNDENNCGLDASALGTAKILKFFDSLFDSINGTLLYPRRGKELRCALSKSSQHKEFYARAKDALKNMYFERNGVKSIPPSLKHWQTVVHGIEDIFQMLQDKVSFLKLRQFNQDPLENFFGQMRQRGSRNINPTATQFQNNYKTLIINNLATKHSVSSNCEEDTSQILCTVKNFVNQQIEIDTTYSIPDIVLNQIVNVDVTKIDAYAIGYISGFLCRKIKSLYSCDMCKSNLLCLNIEQQWHGFTEAKEFSNNVPRKLKYATPTLVKGLCTAYSILKILLPEVGHIKNGFNTILYYLHNYVPFQFKEECTHVETIKKTVIKQFAVLVAHNWATGINRIVNGRDFRYKGNDKIYLHARNYVLYKYRK